MVTAFTPSLDRKSPIQRLPPARDRHIVQPGHGKAMRHDRGGCWMATPRSLDPRAESAAGLALRPDHSASFLPGDHRMRVHQECRFRVVLRISRKFRAVVALIGV
jgi:hypothetical protein